MLKTIQKGSQRIIKKFDFFSPNELLRYKSQTQHKTLCGGFVSLVLIGILLISAYSMLMKEGGLTKVFTKEKRLISPDPTPYKISTSQKGNFMLAIEIYPYNLNQPMRLFDVKLHAVSSKYDFEDDQWSSSITEKVLEPCKPAHFSHWPDIAQKYDSWVMKYWLCLPLNESYSLMGSWMSDQIEFLSLKVSKCRNSSGSVPCAPQFLIDLFMAGDSEFMTTLFFINPSISLESKDEIVYYLEDSNYNYFSQNKGFEGRLYMEDFKIESKETGFPIGKVSTNEGAIISESMTDKDYIMGAYTDTYASFNIFKSKNTRFFERNIVHFWHIFAFILILVLLFVFLVKIMNSYDKFSYEVSLASRIFKLSFESKIRFDNFSFSSYLSQLFYKFLKYLSCSQSCFKETDQIRKCQKQTQKQLDVSYLIDRVNYLETAMSTLIDSHQMKGIHLKDKPSYQQAKKSRRAHKLKKRMNRVKVRNQPKQNSNSGSRNAEFAQMNQKNIDNVNFSEDLQSSANNFKFGEQNSDYLESNVNQSEENDSDITEFSDQEEEKQVNQDDIESINELSKLRYEASNGNSLSRKIVQMSENDQQANVQGINYICALSTNTKPLAIRKNNLYEMQSSNKVAPSPGKQDYSSPERIKPFKTSTQKSKSTVFINDGNQEFKMRKI